MKKPTILKMPHLNLLTLFSKKTCTSFKTIFVAMPFESTNKKRFLSNALAMVGILLFMAQTSFGQNLKPFNIRFDRNVKGDQLLIGNNILSQDNTNFNDKDSYNSDIDMKYVDIDGDASTFSSSSAVLTVPNSNAPAAACYKIAYAALYWSAIIKNGDNSVDRTKFTSIKFKTPVGGYNDITGELIYDAINQTNGIGSDKNRPYACYADVTSLLQTLTDANGTYTVANVLSSTGYNSNTGLSAGWSLYIVYEDPKLPARSITSYDGFSGIGGATTLDINVTGFRTIPSGPVNASFAFAALEGDKPIPGDYLQINGITQSAETATGTTLRATNNFFNSSVTYIDPVTKATANFKAPNRIPSSSNTLGYDAGIITLKNDNNSAIGNNATNAKITLGSTQDVYFYYFNAIAVEIIEPKIILTKKVFDDNGLPAENKAVGLGAILKYELQFQNVGNDNAKNFTISDVLPANTIFNYPADIETPLQAGVTHTYNSATRTITFTIADNLVTKNGNLSVPIRFKVQVVPTCANLTEPCNNIIKNTAKSKYTGEINTNGGLGFGEDSFSSYSACDISVPESTNFLVGVDDCKARNAVLCGDPLTISASGGYASYSWSTSPTGVPVIGTAQTITVTQPGTYYVKNTATPPCVDLEEVITVSGYDAKFNPLVKYADNKDAITGEIPVCPNDGSVLPKIFLCTEDDKVDIDLSDLGATNITWETTTCVADPNLSDLCANESTTCTWTQAGPPGATFVANTAGQYRVSMSFGGCFSRFYFNVYKNGLKPTVSKKDIICGNNGSITIGGISGTGYEYSLSENSGYTSNNTFSISTAGTYTVYIRQVGVATNPCPFKVEGISIYKTDFDPIAPFVTQPLCHDSKGSIKVYGTAYNGAQYTYELFKGGVSIEKEINSTSSEYEFINKDAGSYTYTVTTLDGCSYNGVAEIIAPAALTAVASISKPLTCANGEITVTPTNGTAPYYYYVNGSATSQTDPKIVITTAGTYSILVRDKNNCSYTIPDITINANPKPVFTIAKTDVLCYGAKSGVITFNVTNANGYTLAYSIDNGVTYVANGTFSSLAPGTYKPILKYTLSGVDCFETRPDITITEPAAALTASAGVSELAGCGPAREGKVRITNPQGGVAPYEYSFDNQATWTTVNDAYKAPGTYTLYVRDANKCIFSASVIVDPEPAEPVINVTPQIDFNCDGTATSTVTVANPPNASYTYDYYLDNVKNTNVPSNVFVNVPSGSHSIKVEYKLNAVPTFSNLLFENFGYGEDTTSPGINTAFYCFERQVVATQCRNNTAINDGDYSVTSFIVNPFGAWVQPGDHTPQTVPPTPKGRSLVVNIGDQIATSDILYQKVINDIIPNQPINFELYAMNLLRTGNTQVNADLRVALVDAYGTEISWFATGEIPKTQRWEQYPKTPVTLNPGNNTTLRFIIRSNKRATDGNDVAIDDIKVFQLPKTCISSKSFPLTIDPGKAFTAQITGQKNVTCNGLTNGEFTIAASNFDTTKGYEYSINNGANWSAALFTSPVTVNNLAGNLYKVIVRPVGSSVAACAKPFDVTISVPTAVTLSASVTKLASCTTGATITAIGGGGTPTYQYELRQSNGTTVVTAFVNNGGVFTNVPAGSYTVFVRDANLCVIPTGVPVTVSAVPTLTAALATTTDYCYTTANPATLDVTVTGGVGPYTYKLNTNAADASAATTYSFTNVAPGTHTIVVTDTNNCTATISSIVIAPQLGLTVSLLNDLTCLADASIGNPVITGGNGAPYTYTVSQNGGTPVVVSAFPYSATAAGTYVFTVTDSKGCPAASNTITVTAITTPTITTNKTDITCNNANDGTITVTPAGGFTSAYTYAIKLSSAATYTTQTTNVFTGLVAGTYNVKVIDSKGCESAVRDVIIANPSIVTASIAATDIGCSPTGTVPAVVTVTASGGTGTLQYSFNGTSNFTTSNTYSTSSAVAVTAYVKDANNCQIGPLTITIAAPEQFTAINITDFGWDCRTSPAGGHVNISATGVSSPKRYSIISGPAGFDPAENADGEFKALAPGAYVFQVRDTKTNCILTRAYTIKGTPDILAGGSVTTPILCFSDLGAIQFTVSGLNGHRYDYVVTNTLGTNIDDDTNQSAPTINLPNLPASAYTIVVKDRTTDCTATYTINLTQPTAALAITSAIATNVNCNNDVSQITVTASGGTTNYTYAAVRNLSPAVTPPPAAGVYASSAIITVDTNSGTDLSWDVYVKDANDCTTKTTVTVISDALPAITSVVVGGQCTASGSTFTITATPSAASLTPLTYGIAGPTGAFQASPIFNVAAGTYTVYIKDKNGCIVAAPAPTTVYPQLAVLAQVTKTLDCNTAGPNATITATITGGKANYSYSITNSGGTSVASATGVTGPTITYTGAAADTYTVTVTDANTPGCTATSTVTVDPITNPTVSATPTHVTCNGGNNGAVQLAGSGGSGGYTYSDDNITFVPTSLFSGLTASATPYTFYVKDSKGCLGTITATITEPLAVTLSASITTPYTCTANATITAVASNGNGGFTYVLKRTVATVETTVATNTTGIFPNLTVAGSYTVTATDAKGCPLTSTPMVIDALTPPTAMTFVNSAVTCPANKTDITISGYTGGFGAVEYRISAPAAAVTPFQSSATFTNLDPGVTYRFEIRDAKNCLFSTTYSVPVLPTLSASGVVVSNVVCVGESNGSIRYTVGGFGNNTPYSYTIDGIAAGSASSPLTGTTFDITINGLAAGPHVLVITNTTTNCSATATATVAAPSAPLAITPPTISPITCTKATASITINTAGGWGSNSYTVTGITPAVPAVTQSTKTFNNLAAGDYTATVTDANGCIVSIPFTIAPYTALVLTPTVTAACSVAGNTNQIVATATGGSGTYTYSINTGVAPTGALLDTFNVAPGTYTITVRDAFGCTDTEVVTVNQVLAATALRTKDITCSTPAEATIRVDVTGGKADFGYRVNIGGTGFSGPVIPFPTAGSSTLNYTATSLTGTSYQFEITDANGCTRVTNIVNTNTPTLVTASESHIDPTCNGFTDGSIKLTATAGVAPFTYGIALDPAIPATASLGSANVFGGLAAGTYNYIVRDAKGCEASGTIVLNNPAPLQAAISVHDITCNLADTPGSIEITNVIDGQAPYKFTLLDSANNILNSVNTSSTSYVFPNNLNFGDYYVTVSDAKGCEFKSAKLRINSIPYLTFLPPVISGDCITGATVNLQLDTTFPTAPNYIYSIYGDPSSAQPATPSTTATFTGLNFGQTYFFQVIDNNNCSSIVEVKIDALSLIKIDPVTVTNVTCNTSPVSTNGAINFTVSDYTPSVTQLRLEILDQLTNTSLVPPVFKIVPVASLTSITDSFTGLASGAYTLKVEEVDGTKCAQFYPFDITQPIQPLTSAVTSNVNATCNSGALVTLTTTGGTGPYTYTYAVAPNPPSILASSNVLTLDYNLGTSWNIKVTDLNGCTFDLLNVPIAKDPTPVIAILNVVNCAVEGAFSVDVDLTSPGVGPYTISVNGGSPQNVGSFPYTVSGLSSGPQNIVVYDANGCPSNSAALTLHKKLSVIAERTKELDCTTSPDGLITVTVSDGLFTASDATPDFRYEVSINGAPYFAPVDFGNDTRVFTYPVTTAGTYQFRITDLNNCTVESTVVDIAAIVNPTATAVVTQPTCVGLADGSIKITATGGVLPYEYSIDGGTTWQDSNEFTGLAAGPVNYIVRDDKECLFNGSENIIDPTPVVASASASAFACSPTNTLNATVVTVTASGGAGTVLADYTFSRDNVNWSSTNTFDVIDTGAAQNLTFYAKDANGCTDDIVITINAFPKLVSAVASLGTQADCNTPTEIINVAITGGALPNDFKYEVSIDGGAYVLVNPSTGNSISYPATSIGSFYEFKITDNTTGCSIISNAYTVPVFNTMTLTASAAANVDCATNATGAIEINIGNYTGPYTYEIFNGAVTTGFTGTGNTTTNPFVLPHGLVAGNNYTVVVTQTAYPSCPGTSNVVIITEPVVLDLSAVITVVNQNCNTLGATVTVPSTSVTGGTLGYTYAFMPSGTAPTPADYAASNTKTIATAQIAPLFDAIDVWVKDANGCTDMQTVSISKDPLPSIVLPSAQCFVGAPISIDLSLPAVTTVPIGPVKYYTINGSNQTSPNYTISTPGTYVLSVTDANGCISNLVSYIVQPQLTLQANMTQDLTCPNPASITLVPAGGTNSYTTFEVDNGTGYAVITTNPYTTTTAGTYKFRVTDSQGCQAESQDVIVTPNTTPTAIPVPTDVSCIGSSDGTITLTPSGGNVAYEYSLNGGAYQASNVFSGLGVGAYTILVRDAKLCVSAPITVSIGQPTLLTATHLVTPFGCDTANAPLDAIVTITPAGGTPGYSYSFDNGATYQASSSFSVNTAQTINYIVKDANGCEVTGTADVLPYTPPTDMDLSATPIYCNTPGTVTTVTVNSVTSGVGPFIYEIIAPATAVTVPSTPSAAPFSFASLAPDTYVIKVTDANGCSTTKTIIVEEADKIAATAQVINEVYCNSDSTGTIEFNVSNYIVPANYNFSLSPNLGVMTQVGDLIRYTGVPAGLYNFTVNDLTSGCQAIVPVTVSQPATALDFTATATNINCNNDEATITVTATGGTLDYKYAVVIAGALAPAPTAYGLSNQLSVDTTTGANMVWDVYVMDANGCVTFKQVTILTDANPTIAAAVATQCPSATGTYDITVTASGFSPALQYSADGTTYQTGNVITVNAPGTYTITVKDANGCISVGFPVSIVDPLILTPTVSTPVTCADGDGVVTVSTTGGSGNYVYNIDGGAFASVISFSNVASGNHSIGVRDTTTLCEVFATVNLQVATPITGFALAKTEVTCNGGTDGTITASMDTPTAGVNDNPVYTYTLTGTTTVGNLPVTRPSQDSALFSGLAAGTYTVVVTSERGCTDTETITIIEPGLITVPAPTVVQFGCTSGNTANLATITVTGVTGGSGMYLNYEFIKVGTPNTVVQFSNSNVYNEADLLGGSYIVNVYDDKGCIGTSTASIGIAPYIQLDQVNVLVDQAITCTNLENITVTATTIGGSATNLQYTLVDVTYDDTTTPPTVIKGSIYPAVTNATGIFTNLPVGNYEITVRNLDTNCEIIGVHYVNDPDTFDLTIDNVVDVTCFGGNNGSARVTLIDRVPTPIDNAGPFDYTVYDIANPLAPVVVVPTTNSPTFGPITLTGLGAGTYMITATLTNTPNCTVSKNFTITGPSEILAISETHTEITCVTGNNDGSISATATGGWSGGYEFQLENGATIVSPWSTVSDFNALTAGSYTVKVRDSKGCEVFTTVVLNNPTPIVFTATPSTTLLACIRDTNASITVSVPTGGQGSNYLYTLNTTSATPMISSGPQSGNVFNNLGAGTYTVTVTDGWGCGTTSAPIVINEPTEVVASLVLATTQTCSTQSTITLSATGGTGTYQYSTTPNFATVAGSFASSITMSVPVGTYRFYVRDANGCISVVSNDITIDPLPALQVVLNVDNAKINCNGDTNGVIVATATGGLGNYVYTLLDGTGNPIVPAPTQLTPGNFTQLPAGTYQVRVDSQDCTVTSTGVVTITEPLLPVTASTVVTPVTCNGAANGIITVTASGGTGVIKYAISPRLDQFFDTGVFDQLAPGTYQIIVQDENGCFILLSEEITEPQPIFVNTVAGSEVQELCAGDNNAVFDVNITGGVAPYSVALDDINGTYVTGALSQTEFKFTGLSGGEHTVYIKDANGCTAEWIVTLDESVNLDPKATVTYGCDNNSPSSTVTVTVDASITNPADVDYALDGSTVFQASNIFSNLAPGPHTITARHTNGCEKTTIQFEVIGFTPLALTLSDGGLNEIVATATGGAGNYQYSFDGGNTFSSNNKLIYYKSGDYTVIVRDANGCEATATRYFEFIDIEIPNVFTPNGDGNNDTWTPTNTINYKDLTINIFDRYGRKVATLREGQGWDGKYNSLELPTGDYWYVLKLKNVQDDREFVGHFTLMR